MAESGVTTQTEICIMHIIVCQNESWLCPVKAWWIITDSNLQLEDLRPP